MKNVAYILIFNNGSSSSNNSSSILIYYTLWRIAGQGAIRSHDTHSIFQLIKFCCLFKCNTVSNFIPNANTDSPVPIYPIANLHVQYILYFVFPLCYLKIIYIINYMNKYLRNI